MTTTPRRRIGRTSFAFILSLPIFGVYGCSRMEPTPGVGSVQQGLTSEVPSGCDSAAVPAQASSPTPVPPGTDDYNKLPPGFYQVQGTNNRFKIMDAKERGWCWYNMLYAPTGEGPANTSVIPPQDKRDPSNGGRCSWDYSKGNYRTTGRGSDKGGLDGNVYYYNGASAYCWFSSAKPSMSDTTLPREQVGKLATTGFAGADGQCMW